MINTIKESIAKYYHLERENKEWLVQGSEGKIRLKVPNHRAWGNSIGFSLDKDLDTDLNAEIESKTRPPLAFFSGNPPENLAKMCDAMIAMTYQQKLYLLAIELKSGDTGDYKKQLANGKHFWQWLMALCKEHGYINSVPIYASVLIMEPRNTQSKGQATRQHNICIEENKVGDWALTVKNQTTINIGDILEILAEKTN